MFRLRGYCPICGTGSVGFRRCSRSEAVVLMCDECESIWLDPEEIDRDHVHYVSAPGFAVEALQDCSVKAPESRWATESEIAQQGRAAHIDGEVRSPSEGGS